MRMIIFSVFDTATGMYMRPFFSAADGQAKRLFSDLVMDAEHDVGKHPEDYSLVRLGRFDDVSGEIDGEKTEVLLTGLAVVAQSRNKPKLQEWNEERQKAEDKKLAELNAERKRA